MAIHIIHRDPWDGLLLSSDSSMSPGAIRRLSETPRAALFRYLESKPLARGGTLVGPVDDEGTGRHDKPAERSVPALVVSMSTVLRLLLQVMGAISCTAGSQNTGKAMGKNDAGRIRCTTW